MPWGAAAAAGGAILSSQASKDAAGTAASGDKAAQLQQMMATQQMLNMLKPYRDAGKKGVGGQLDLLGLSGGDAQQAAIDSLEKSPQFTSLVKSGENALLQNASATGGLRGGNTSAALAEFRPQMLSNIIESQYGKLTGLANLGENAAAQSGNQAQTGANNIGSYMQNSAQNSAAGQIAQGQTYANLTGQIAKMGGERGWF